MFDFDIAEQRKTWDMRLDPESPADFVLLDGPANQPLSLSPVLSGDAFSEVVNYPIIVVGWDKRKHGRIRREWEKTFTQAERKKIGRYYGKFYRWYLITGTPHKVMLRLNTINLLQRAVAFFATV